MTITSRHTTILLLLQFTPLISCLTSHPLDEHAYSARSIAEYSPQFCSDEWVMKHIPNKSLFHHIEDEMERPLCIHHFGPIIPYADLLLSTAGMMLECLSPGQDTAACPFDSQITRRMHMDELRKATVELNRIQTVSLLAIEIQSTLDEALSVSEIVSSVFYGKLFYRKAQFLDHFTQPTLDSIWHSICHAPLEDEFVFEESPAERNGQKAETSLRTIMKIVLAIFFESPHARSFLIVITIMFGDEALLPLIFNPMKCRYVKRRFDGKYFRMLRL